MMDHKWSVYHDISSNVERTSLKLYTLFKLNFIFSLSIIYLSIVLRLCE